MPDQVYGVSWNGASKVSYTYDGLGRLTNKKTGSFNNKYSYIDVGTANTTTFLKSVTTPAGTYTYAYDKLGNIQSVSDGKYTTSYAYDALNQLVRENDQRAGKTYTYSYSNGNITSRKEYAYTTGTLGTATATKSWTYGDGVWKDLLTNYNGTAITYDTIGNPTKIGAKTLTWEGRRLTKITDGSKTYSYAYNGDGQRVSKTVNGTKTEYYYNGSILAGQKTGSNKLVFMYDSNGDPFGFKYNNTEYYYVKNAQNDVIAITDSTGKVIANYYYDAWGKLLSVTDANGKAITASTNVAIINPIRYRSYYYDTETGYYYLSSRYYSPDMCRFLNADSLVSQDSVLGNNMFAYCLNNPSNMSDETGNLPFFAITAAIGAVAGSIIGGVVAAKNGGNVWAGIGIGAAVGGLAGAGLGALSAAALAGSFTASTGLVVSGAGVLTSTVSAGGIGAGITYVSQNLSLAVDQVKNYVADKLTGLSSGANATGKGTKSQQSVGLHTSGIGSPKNNINPGGSYTKLDYSGRLYSYTQFDNLGRQSMRIDFQGRSHAGVLPHIHIYIYPQEGGRVEYIFDLNWNLIN